MARIKDEDIQLVRDRVRIDEVVEQYVTLRNAGGGARKGLCPFHDEKSPSFNVRPAQGFYHCFGCGAGGDSIKFLMEIEGLTFVESVERLAAKYGIQLKYDDTAYTGPRRDPGQRQRLIEAHRVAQEYYAQMLRSSPDAMVGRTFVTDRGFDQTAAEQFGMGWAPRGGEALVGHLRGKGFTEEDLVTGGLAARGSRGLYDKFRGRLLWPIREISGETIGFGARRLFDDDRIEAKYLNTSETPIYRKSQVLYGIDLARRAIAGRRQAVIVEGYTDVMACHQAGITTAVATCGTAFGEDHGRVLRRLLLDQDAFHGEVIFTFDGDEAGQRAALKAFKGDEQFVAQTYVAVEPRGMDPCDLRLADGDQAVRDLISARIPLYRFVLTNTLGKFDLDRGDQRIDAVREAVGLASSIRDTTKVDEFLREVSARVGADIDVVRAEHQRAARQGGGLSRTGAAAAPVTAAQSESFGADKYATEREALKVLAQYPHLVGPGVGEVTESDFSHPVARALFAAMTSSGLPTTADASWLPAVSDRLQEPVLRQVLSVAAVEPLHTTEESTAAFVPAVLARLREQAVSRRIDDVRSKLQRTDAASQAESYGALFSELMSLEQQRKQLQAQMASAPGAAG